MPLIIPVSRNSSTNQSGSGGGGGLGPLSRIYAEYETSKKKPAAAAVKKRSRSADRKDGGDGDNKKRSFALKDRSIVNNTNVNVMNEKSQKQYSNNNEKMKESTTIIPCSYVDGCTDKSVKDGLCKAHWCAINLCARDECSNLAWSKGLCREHEFPMSNSVSVEEDDIMEMSSEDDEVRGTVKEVLQVKEEEVTSIEVNELHKKQQKQNTCGAAKQSSAQRKPCLAEGCSNQSVVNGVCFRHGAKRKLCDTDGCTNHSIRGGVCFRHGAKRKLCNAEGCTNLTQRRGVCVRHGAFVVDAEVSGSSKDDYGDDDEGEEEEANGGGPVLCVEIPPDHSKTSSELQSHVTYELKETPVAVLRSVSASSTETLSVDAAATAGDTSTGTASGSSNEDNPSSSGLEECTCGVVKGVRCTKHKKRRKHCTFEGCTNQAVVGGICIRHGAKVKRCSHDGCENVVQKRGLCRRHGAYMGETTCSFDGCNNSESEGGLCLRHGKNGNHGEKRAKCSNLLCTSAAVDGVMCIRHRALSTIDGPSPPSTNPITRGSTKTKSGRKVKPCKSEGCTNRAIQGGQCFRHGAKAHRKLCSSEGCKNYVVRAGICIKHGARQVSKKNTEEEPTHEKPAKSLKQEEDNSIRVDHVDKRGQDDLFKSIDQLEGNCADILLLLKNDG
ncbi:hypothetical protein QTG54_006642 [Skeletonema marinoi]|uniref:WRKY transcription factor 19 n=1 Tax=Skeletonema marinoi TaxID=267567 RepID=A0AAD8YDJ7_9STRA|nr:hypothetical protein QTG54_006642 [Skeletonema marinoi]